jgi:molecular chaperone DnaK
VEVTFDIDANGILSVSAKDKDTGAEQAITITDTGNLDQSEVERMVQDAQAHRDEDSRLRTMVDARNQLEASAYQIVRRLDELGDAVPGHERARADMLVNDARQAIKEDAPLDRIRELTGEVQQAHQSLMAAGGPAGAGPTPGIPGASGQAPGGRPPADNGGDDVIDADFTPQ